MLMARELRNSLAKWLCGSRMKPLWRVEVAGWAVYALSYKGAYYAATEDLLLNDFNLPGIVYFFGNHGQEVGYCMICQPSPIFCASGYNEVQAWLSLKDGLMKTGGHGRIPEHSLEAILNVKRIS